MSCILNYSLTGITGDCSNLGTGSFGISINGTAPTYTIQWISPITDPIPLGLGVTAYTATNLSSGTHTFSIVDSCADPSNNVLGPISVYISSGTCASITSINNTVCNLDNGSLTATTQYDYGNNKYYLYHNTLGYITSATTSYSITPPGAVFNNLTPGTYYVIADDGGGCTGVTSSVIIQDSTNLDFDIYVVNDAGCSLNSGKLFINNLNGNPPYTYLWSNGATTDSIENLINGTYGVTVSDRTGCVVNKLATVLKVPPIGQAGVYVTQPSCFGNNGTLTLIVSGGTAPYYFSGSNGTITVQFSDTYTFENLASGNFSYYVQDAALCKFTNSTSLSTPLSYNIVSINTQNSKCNNTSGKVSVLVSSGTPPYTFKLTAPDGSNKSVTTESTSYEFTGLVSGVYTLSILDIGECEFIKTYEILNEELFTVDFNVTGTTCGLSNGIVEVTVDGGTGGPYLYELDGQSVPSNLLTNTFKNLDNGSYTLSVTDTNVLCKQNFTLNVQDSNGVDFNVNPQNPTSGNNGQIQLFITKGQPPFVYVWSPNVGSQTGQLVTNLSEGTYNVKITDDNGCVNEKTITLQGISCSVAYEIYNFSSENFKNNGELMKKGPHQMLTEGYNDLTNCDNNCVLNGTIFEAIVSVGDITKSLDFYNGTGLDDYPSDSLWGTTIRGLLLTFDGVGDVTINNSTNKITIVTDCESEVSLLDTNVLIKMAIHYDISCESGLLEYTPTECEITEEYCETPDTKVIYPAKIDIFGFDFLADVNIVPTRCVELSNYLDDCDSGDLDSDFRAQRDARNKYGNEYLLSMISGLITIAESIPVVLPPSMNVPLNSFHKGPNNNGWKKMNVLQGCSCKKIFKDLGFVGPEYDFEVVYLTEVQSYGDLPLTSNFGTSCWVINDEMFYQWDPTSDSWINGDLTIDGYPNIDECAGPQRDQRDDYLRALNELALASRPFTWSNFYIPFYQIYKYKT
jgi:hypothetical protein